MIVLLIFLFNFSVFVRVNAYYMRQPVETTEGPGHQASNATLKVSENVEHLPAKEEVSREEKPPVWVAVLDAAKQLLIENNKSPPQNSKKVSTVTSVSPLKSIFTKVKDVAAENFPPTPKKTVEDTVTKIRDIEILNNNKEPPIFSKESYKETSSRVEKIETATKNVLLMGGVNNNSSNVSEIANNVVSSSTFSPCDSGSSLCKSAQGCHHGNLCTYVLIFASSLYFYHTTLTF